MNSKELNKLSPLPSTGVELRNISKFFEQNKVLTRNSARESNLTDDLLKNASIISFATHAVEDISEESYEVGLVLTPPNKPTNKDDGFLTRREISSLKLNSPTVILSACNTARGLYEGADRYSGLPAGFFEAGANTLVLSRWDLETNSAREMSTLAMEIATRENIPIGSAYNQAMREFINNPEYARYSHPFYWAGFQTIGK